MAGRRCGHRTEVGMLSMWMLHRDVWAAAAAAKGSRKADSGKDVRRMGDIRLRLPKVL